MYLTDSFNLLDFCTFHVLLAAVLLPERSHEKALAWSVATCLAWLRLLRMLELFKSWGPLVLMFIEMIRDVVQLLVLNLFVLLAIACGMWVLFNSIQHEHDDGSLAVGAAATANASGGSAWPNALPPQCSALANLRGDLHSHFFWIVFVLLNGMISGDS